MIQDIKPLFLDNHFRPEEKVKPDSLIIVIREGGFLINEAAFSNEGIIDFPKGSDFISDEGFIYTFSIGNESFFLSTDDSRDFKIPGFSYTQLSSIKGKELLPKHRVFAAFTAYHLMCWYSSSVYCGKCGSRNVNDTRERARRCPECGNVTYPRINPAVIIGITDKTADKIILTKYNRGYANFALVAGFTEIGETLEESVMREAMEEVGLKVTNIRYYKSQPWGIAGDILVGYFCDVDGDTEIYMDNEELKLAGWYAPSEIRLQPTKNSLTNEMMTLFKEKGYAGTIDTGGKDNPRLLGKADGETVAIFPDQILYIESVDDKIFAYTPNKVIRLEGSLSTLIQKLNDDRFFRCSKSMIINIDRVEKLKSLSSNRIDATMEGGEHILISRTYASEFRRILKG